MLCDARAAAAQVVNSKVIDKGGQRRRTTRSAATEASLSTSRGI